MSVLGTISRTVDVPDTVREVIEVVARVVVPVTKNVPLIVWSPKNVVDPMIAVSIYPYVE